MKQLLSTAAFSNRWLCQLSTQSICSPRGSMPSICSAATNQKVNIVGSHSSYHANHTHLPERMYWQQMLLAMQALAVPTCAVRPVHHNRSFCCFVERTLRNDGVVPARGGHAFCSVYKMHIAMHGRHRHHSRIFCRASPRTRLRV